MMTSLSGHRTVYLCIIYSTSFLSELTTDKQHRNENNEQA